MLTIGKLGGYAVYMTGPDALGQRVRVGKAFVHFDFDEHFGPLIVDRHGEPTDAQPNGDDHPFWAPFEAWLSGYWKAKGAGDLEAYLRQHDGTRPVKALAYPNRSHPKEAAEPSGNGTRGRTDASLTPGTNQSKLKEERS